MLSTALGYEEPTSIYPPYYSAGPFDWATPFFLSSTTLLVLITVLGLARYIQTRDSPWIDVDSLPASLPVNRQRLAAFPKLIVYMSYAILFSYLGDAAVIISRVLFDGKFISGVFAYYVGTSWLAWAASQTCLWDETQKFGEWHGTQYAFWVAAAIGETTVGWLWAMAIYHPEPGTEFESYDYVLLVIFIIRYTIELILVLCAAVQLFSKPMEETQPLLTHGSVPTSAARGYGSLGAIPTCDTSRPEEPNTFSNIFAKLRKLMPFIWPKNDPWLQFLVVLDFMLLLSSLAINVWTPLQIGAVVDRLGEGKGKFAWGVVLAYVGLRFLQGGSGLIQSLQNWIWIPVGQYTTREVSVKLFSHLHSLSLDYHITRKTGEVLRVMDRGTSSIVQLLSQLLFQIFPALANIVLAVVVFAFWFSPPFGLIVFITMALYIFATIAMTEWRTKFRRRMIELDNFARTKAVDSLLNFETVKYYGAEDFEVNRYKNAVIEYQQADWESSVSLNLLNLAQNTIITGGLLAGCLLFAWKVSEGQLTSGDFVVFNMYMMQLYTPLHWFGTYYRMIQSNFVDMEKMLALFEVEQSVKDAPDAKELVIKEGHVVFENVTFCYDNRQTALNGISFSIPKGATVALVGPSGGGKSTILRLLFRFYDPASGRICIDGQDIRSVYQSSLRKSIGVVPQDTVLFNDTILYNIRYGDVNADEEAVIKAAKAAQIHDKILSFSDGYETKVGERGLRLSGGEKQRVAIARTILKDPPIILLDEATSALDTTTERQIQKALSTMTKDRTTLVIAHRLSTIINADLILVIKDGTVVETGTHEELIKKMTADGQQGVYSEMWQKQLHDENEDQSDTIHESDTSISEDDKIKINSKPPSASPVPISSSPVVETAALAESPLDGVSRTAGQPKGATEYEVEKDIDPKVDDDDDDDNKASQLPPSYATKKAAPRPLINTAALLASEEESSFVSSPTDVQPGDAGEEVDPSQRPVEVLIEAPTPVRLTENDSTQSSSQSTSPSQSNTTNNKSKNKNKKKKKSKNSKTTF
ncbi:hypothetical protein J3Q64DRAFT_1732499 [Phycomyces blakesleeanus]|uniref:Uncharacterized protein n=2 Tax=Phycomyces blakesleeanus TaxID=4837 RepID=A0ABR3B3H5_PHYBL